MKSTLVIEIIGMIAGVCTTISFLPQVIKVIKTKSTEDISLWMFILMNTGIALWLTYGILLNALPIILANGITLVLSLTILWYKIKFSR